LMLTHDIPEAKVGEVWLVERVVEMKWSAWSVLRKNGAPSTSASANKHCR
jgi:hypothetical protein